MQLQSPSFLLERQDLEADPVRRRLEQPGLGQLGGGDEELLADGEIQLAVHGLGEGRNDPAAARQAGPDLKRQGLADLPPALDLRSEEHTSELQSLMRIS